MGNSKIEVSLLELLNNEKDCVNMINETYRALKIAKNGGIRTIEYERELKMYTDRLKESREKIREYFETKLV